MLAAHRCIRIAKWVGVSLCCALISLGIRSFIVIDRYRWLNNDLQLDSSIQQGGLTIAFCKPYVDISPNSWRTFDNRSLTVDSPIWFPFYSSQVGPAPSFSLIALPLWLPILIVAIPTYLMWRKDHNRPRKGQCIKCRYDLTGNTSGICPECGTLIASDFNASKP
jgi:hypothetical protein